MRSRKQNSLPYPVGKPRKCPPYEEDRIAEFLLACSEQGIPLTRYHCLQLFSQVAVELGEVGNIIKLMNVQCYKGLIEYFSELKNTVGGDKFLSRFLERHKELSTRITHSPSRKKYLEGTKECFEEYILNLNDLHQRGFLSKPEKLWNLDETAFNTSEMFSSKEQPLR